MSLESATYISDLVQANPTGSDDASQGDDHLRLLKTVLQTTFPNGTRAFRFPDSYNGVFTLDNTYDQALISIDASAGNISVALPSSPFAGLTIHVWKRDSSSNSVTLTTSASTEGSLVVRKQFQMMTARYITAGSLNRWMVVTHVGAVPYYSGGQDIPFSDIAPSANAKRILGAATATDFSEQTIATVLEWLGTAARGDLILRGANAFAFKNLGTSGQVLVSDGTDLVYGSPPIPARAYATYAAQGAINATIPYDDTIPQIGEGTDIFGNVTITPIKSSSRIRVHVSIWGAMDATAGWMVALFKDGAASAVQAVAISGSAGATEQGILDYEFAPGSVSLITFTVRVGVTSNAFYTNGISTGRKLGGGAFCTIEVTELFTA